MVNFLLILVFLIITIYLWYVFTILYHFIRFGIGRLPKIIALVFFIISFLILISGIFLLFYFGKISQEVILEKLVNFGKIFKIK